MGGTVSGGRSLQHTFATWHGWDSQRCGFPL